MTKKQQQKIWATRKKVQRMIPLENTKCEKCGTAEDLQRHHIDGNRNNNRKANFQILCREHHIERHLEMGTWTEASRYTRKGRVQAVANKVYAA